MKCTVIIQKDGAEEVVIYAHEQNALVEKIQALVESESVTFMGYAHNAMMPLQPDDIFCVMTEGGKVYALTQQEKWQLKSRLYQVEKDLPQGFVKINQSCIANIQKIERFHVTMGGTLQVVFQNGHVDYVSRRQLKNVKERLGF